MKKYKHLRFLFLLGVPASLFGQQPDGLAILNLPDTHSIRQVLDQAAKMERRHSDSAAILYQKALYQSLQISYSNGILGAYTELAILAAKNGQYSKAMAMARQGITYSDTIENMEILATLYNCIGNVHYVQMQLEQAFNSYREAAYYSRNNHERSASIFNNIASTLYLIGQPSKAIAYIDRALKLCSPQTDPGTYVALLNNKTNTLEALGYHDSSSMYGDSAIVEAKRHQLHSHLAIAITHKSRGYLRAQEPAKAFDLLRKEAVALLNVYNVDVEAKFALLQELGVVSFRLKHYTEAEHYLKKAKASPSFKNQIYIDKLLSELYAITGQYKKAYIHYRRYKEKEDSAGAYDLAFRVNDLEVQYRTLQKDNELALRSLQLANKQKVISQQHSLIILLVAGTALAAVLLLWRYKHVIRKQQHERELNRLKNVLEGEEKERSRLARELHDNINSQLAAVQAHLTAGQKAFPFLLENKNMNTAQHLLQGTAESVRRVAHNMAPYHLQSLGLVNAIKLFYQNLFADISIQVEVNAYGEFRTVEAKLVLTIYRIAQELGQNVKKHAEASQFLLMLCRAEDEITLTAEDNGKGFKVADPKKKSSQAVTGIGLSGIQERINIYEGTMEIETSAQVGTTIFIRFPYNNSDTEISDQTLGT